MNAFLYILSIWAAILAASTAWAEIPAVLTDKIRSGNGVIDLFKDVAAPDLQQYLQSGTLKLGVDINEDASGNESSTSAGVAIKQMELILKTTAGDFSFTEFYTNTSALILEKGATQAQSYYTLFGGAGSSQITGSTAGFDISSFDDVITLDNIQFTGDIIGASLKVSFLDTGGQGANETFFDYSAGFEEFAILTSADAAALDAAAKGLGGAPATISYSVAAPSGTPEPSWYLLAAVPLTLLFRGRHRAKTSP